MPFSGEAIFVITVTPPLETRETGALLFLKLMAVMLRFITVDEPRRIILVCTGELNRVALW